MKLLTLWASKRAGENKFLRPCGPQSLKEVGRATTILVTVFSHAFTTRNIYIYIYRSHQIRSYHVISYQIYIYISD